LFAASFAVRILVWQNNKIEMATVQTVVTENYLRDAHKLASDDVRTFVAGDDPPTNARVIDHPPGYPLAVGVVYAVAGDGDAWRFFQIALNSLAGLLLFLIAAALFSERVGIIAGSLAALSPQLAYHSGLLLPDELSVIPILAAIYFLVRAMKDARLMNAVLCGLFLGVSCWLRSNALLLPVFFAIAATTIAAKGSRLEFTATIVAVFLFIIAPITFRNAVCFDSFVPLSLGAGTTLVEGLGDIDDGSRGLPLTDEDVMALDARLDASGTTYTALYDPNGVERERRRIAFGRSVVAADPLWFAWGVVKRGSATLRLERVPAIAPDRDEKETTNVVLYWINKPLKFLQRVFVTSVFLPLGVLGVIVLWLRKCYREMIVVAAVPLYYLTVQPLVHTEYRYVLASLHFMFIFAAFAVCWACGKMLRRNVKGDTAAQ
jgi:hypothetical protein